jgi:hypothetical protein
VASVSARGWGKFSMSWHRGGPRVGGCRGWAGARGEVTRGAWKTGAVDLARPTRPRGGCVQLPYEGEYPVDNRVQNMLGAVAIQKGEDGLVIRGLGLGVGLCPIEARQKPGDPLLPLPALEGRFFPLKPGATGRRARPR